MGNPAEETTVAGHIYCEQERCEVNRISGAGSLFPSKLCHEFWKLRYKRPKMDGYCRVQ
jgi:hypothetical protein